MATEWGEGGEKFKRVCRREVRAVMGLNGLLQLRGWDGQGELDWRRGGRGG